MFALVIHGTIQRACEDCGISTVTAWRWLQQPTFQQHLRSLRRRVFDATVADLQAAGAEAVSTLRRNLSNADTAIQVRAAQVLLTMIVKIQELDFEERLERLENELEGKRLA